MPTRRFKGLKPRLVATIYQGPQYDPTSGGFTRGSNPRMALRCFYCNVVLPPAGAHLHNCQGEKVNTPCPKCASPETFRLGQLLSAIYFKCQAEKCGEVFFKEMD